MDSAQKHLTYEACRTVLEENWHDTHTIPAANLYPHQWLWDSSFNAIGWSHIDIEKAQMELRSLLKGQWANGMLPHMIFADSGKGGKDRLLWQAWRNPHAPEGVNTTGMTQPPVLAEAVVRIGEKLPLLDRRSWYQDMFPALVAYHQWLYKERDPHGEGLVLLVHPWESGFDSSPPWINQLHMHSKPWWVSLVDNKVGRVLIRLIRRDTRHVPPGQRLDDIDVMMYMNVMQRLRRKDWDIDRILARSHFAIDDLAFNSILIRANEHLKTIAKTIHHKLPEKLEERIELSKVSLEKLWDTGHGQYFSRNALTHKSIKEPTIATLMPLYAGCITKDRASELVRLLKDRALFACDYPIPTVPFSSTYYNEMSYWQGPAWVNTNWMIIDGLRRYGFDKEADTIATQTIRMVSQSGPWEYFSARSGEPAGAEKFSWTAALTIDLLQNNTSKN